MYSDEIRDPVSLARPEFLSQEEDSAARVSLAAYLLLAGPLFVEGVDRSEDEGVLPPSDELEAVGINPGSRERVEARAADYGEFDPGADVVVPAQELAEIAATANASGNPYLASRAVALATRSDDELIRICALGSAVEFFDPVALNVPDQVSWFLRNARQTQTLELMWTLLGRLWGAPLGASPAPPATPPSASAVGLIAIHGTVLPFSRPPRPEWSVPPNGSLFMLLRNRRSDAYDKRDYFRWEGGYTDHAREVALANLFDWVDRRAMGDGRVPGDGVARR
jgi:hypothetical protein